MAWQRNRDSNPNKQSQSLSCYRYTIPLCATITIIPFFSNLSRKIYLFLVFFEKSFSLCFFKLNLAKKLSLPLLEGLKLLHTWNKQHGIIIKYFLRNIICFADNIGGGVIFQGYIPNAFAFCSVINHKARHIVKRFFFILVCSH